MRKPGIIVGAFDTVVESDGGKGKVKGERYKVRGKKGKDEMEMRDGRCGI